MPFTRWLACVSWTLIYIACIVLVPTVWKERPKPLITWNPLWRLFIISWGRFSTIFCNVTINVVLWEMELPEVYIWVCSLPLSNLIVLRSVSRNFLHTQWFPLEKLVSVCLKLSGTQPTRWISKQLYWLFWSYSDIFYVATIKIH